MTPLSTNQVKKKKTSNFSVLPFPHLHFKYTENFCLFFPEKLLRGGAVGCLPIPLLTVLHLTHPASDELRQAPLCPGPFVLLFSLAEGRSLAPLLQVVTLFCPCFLPQYRSFWSTCLISPLTRVDSNTYMVWGALFRIRVE